MRGKIFTGEGVNNSVGRIVGRLSVPREIMEREKMRRIEHLNARDRRRRGNLFLRSRVRSKLAHGFYDGLYVGVLAYIRCECARDGTRRDGRITYIHVDCVAMGATIIYNARRSVERARLYGATQHDDNESSVRFPRTVHGFNAFNTSFSIYYPYANT